MPIPVTFPQNTPLIITDLQNTQAEALLQAFLQIMDGGTSGAATTTPPYTIPDPNNPGSTINLLLNTAPNQLVYRQLALAMAFAGIGGGGSTFQRICQNSLSLGCGVYYSANDQVSPGSCLTPLSSPPGALGMQGIVGVSMGAYSATTEATLQSAGVVLGCLSAAAPGVAYYLGNSGQPVLDSALSSGDRIIRLGYSKNATDLEVSIQDIGLQP